MPTKATEIHDTDKTPRPSDLLTGKNKCDYYTNTDWHKDWEIPTMSKTVSQRVPPKVPTW